MLFVVQLRIKTTTTLLNFSRTFCVATFPPQEENDERSKVSLKNIKNVSSLWIYSYWNDLQQNLYFNSTIYLFLQTIKRWIIWRNVIPVYQSKSRCSNNFTFQMKINFSHSLIILQQQQNQNIEMAKTRIIAANKNLCFHFHFIIIKSCFRVQR